MRLNTPVEDRCSTNNKRIFCRVVEVRHNNRYVLQCRYGVRDFIVLKVWTAFPHQIPAYTKRVAIESLLFGKLHAFSPLLSSPKCVVAVKGAVLQFAVHVLKQKLTAHFIAMAEMVVPSAQTPGILQLYLAHSFLH